MLGAPTAIINFLQIVAAWSSDFAIVILFNRIYPGLRLKDYIKAQSSPKLKFSILGTVVIIQVIITVVVILLLSTASGTPAIALSDRTSTRLNSSHVAISYSVFCLKKKY